MESTYPPEMWRDLYAMLGSSSAALIGLLFVVASLRIDEFKDNRAFQIRARNNTLHLLAMLVQAAAVLTPQPQPVLGAEVVGINLCGLWLPLSICYKVFYKDKVMGRHGGLSIYRAVTYCVGYALGIAGGVGLIKLSNWGIYLVTISYVAFLVSVILNAWKIMFWVEQPG